MNRKGFTLVELLATIVVLTLVLSISTYSVIAIIKNAKKNNYNLLIENIKDASELYYQECKYEYDNNSGITCSTDGRVTLGDLVKYGYLKGNSTGSNDKYGIVNPLDNSDISSCVIQIDYQNGSLIVTSISDNSSCSFEYSESINTGNGDSNLPSTPSFPSRSIHSGIIIHDDDIEPIAPSSSGNVELPVDPVTPGYGDAELPVKPITPVVPKEEDA